MKMTAIRLGLTAALVFVTYLGIGATRQFLTVPPIRQLSLDVRKLPEKLGDWLGTETTKLDPETFVKTGANLTIERIYHDAEDHEIKMYLATFDDPDEGVYHSPLNCYRSHGWRLISESKVDVPIPDRPPQQISLSTWELKGETVLVAFWYRLGDHTLFERWDMGRVRLAMSGMKEWPPLVKVLLETPTSDKDSYPSRARIEELTKRIQQWLDQSNAEDKQESADK